MTKVGLIKFILVCLCVNAAFAQKVKYKDVFGLLSTKQYEQAEPFLRKYLRDNDDNPNAFLYMGIIFQEKSGKLDILKQTSQVRSYIDSSILFYDKAYKTIDEKEVRKNKEYYEVYNRRDLRTGEFGVKLSDIQFDLEKRIQGLRERVDRLKMTKFYFTLSDSLYRNSQQLFKAIQKNYATDRQLYLRSDDLTLKDLSALTTKFDSCLKAFENYKASSGNLGRTGYNQQLTLIEVSDISKDGHTAADFYSDDLKLWNYKKFATHATEIIQKDIVPMRSHLISYDIEINKLRERLNSDSVSVKNDLTKLIDVLLYEQLQKYDPNPLPMEVFCMKTSDLEYRSTLMENKKLRDSANVHLQLQLLNNEMKYLRKLDSISSKLASEDIDQKALDYAYFITNTYGNTIVLHSYIKALKEYSDREKKKKNEQLTRLHESLNWIIDGADSIPAKSGVVGSKYVPLFTVEEKFTVGLAFKDSLTADGYFYNVSASRKPEIKFSFPVDKVSFKKSTIPSTKALTYADPNGSLYYVLVYSDRVAKDQYPATLTKIYKADGVAWSNNLVLPFIPSEISFKPETSELTIKDSNKQMLVDKNGKVLK
jgi:hypothetical protein